MHHIIIGAGPAGVIAAETIRKLNPAVTISLIGEEPEPPYSRMALPYLLSAKIDEKGTYLRKAGNYFANKNIQVIQDRVTVIDPPTKTVKTQRGGAFNYDKLLIASGAHPVTPSIPGIESSGVHPCWTLADARQIMRLAQPGGKVVLMGAGFIGSIIMEALISRGIELTVIEAQNQMIPRMMNATSAHLVKTWCERQGVTVMLATKVDAIEHSEGEHPLNVRLDHGNVLHVDLVIIATGVKPNIAFLAGSGIDTDEGVLVDPRLQSSQAHVYAAGDVAQGMDFSTGAYSVQAIQPTAADHGRLAAYNMVSQTQSHRGSLNMNVLDTLGLISSSFGLWMGVDGGDSAELIDADHYRYINLQFKDDTLVGASALGLTEHIGVLRGLIQSRIHLKAWKRKLMRDPTRIMEAYLANTQAIVRDARVLSGA